MAVYQFSDFESAAKKAGLYDTFSAADLKLAQKHPDAGMSILQYKQDYVNAQNDETRALANAGAERIRSAYGNYSGGEDGSAFHLGDPSSIGFESGTVPSYRGRYDDKIDEALARVLSAPSFSYDEKTDPLYAAYRKQYAREGERATADTLGSAAAASGGIPSSYAVTAAQQAGDLYAAKAADKLPELYELAYRQYLDEYQRRIDELDALRDADKTDYARYRDAVSDSQDTRDFDYAQYLDEIAQNERERTEQKKSAERAAQYGDYSFLNDLGIRTDAAERKTALEEAERAAAYGDLSKLRALGIDTRSAEYDRALTNALTAAKYGDRSGLAALGIDLSVPESEEALKRAETAAKYGDYSGLAALGIDLSAHEREAALKQAETAAKYGDFSGLAALGIDTEQAKKEYEAKVVQEAEKAQASQKAEAENPLTFETVRSLLSFYPDGILPDSVWMNLIDITPGLTTEHLRQAGFVRQSQSY